MKHLAILFLILTPAITYAQDNSQQTKKASTRKLQIGFIVSPDICYRTLRNAESNSSYDPSIRLINENDQPKPGFTAGVNICYSTKQNISFEAGLQYSNKGFQTKSKDLVFQQPDPNAPSSVKIIYSFHSLDIPLKANFTFGKNKLRFITSAGFTTNIFVRKSQKSLLEYDGRTDKQTSSSGFSRVTISPMLSAGIDYKVDDRSNLRVEPTFRYGVIKLNEGAFAHHLYSVGLSLGYYVSL